MKLRGCIPLSESLVIDPNSLVRLEVIVGMRVLEATNRTLSNLTLLFFINIIY